MSDEIQLHIESIARHLRGLGLTEQQIELHVAPLKTRHVAPNPSRRKIGRHSIMSPTLFPTRAKALIWPDRDFRAHHSHPSPATTEMRVCSLVGGMCANLQVRLSLRLCHPQFLAEK